MKAGSNSQLKLNDALVPSPPYQKILRYLRIFSQTCIIKDRESTQFLNKGGKKTHTNKLKEAARPGYLLSHLFTELNFNYLCGLAT